MAKGGQMTIMDGYKKGYCHEYEPLGVLILRELHTFVKKRNTFTVEDVVRAVRRHRPVQQTTVRQLVIAAMQRRSDYRSRLVRLANGQWQRIYEPASVYQVCPLCGREQCAQAMTCEVCETVLSSLN